MLFFFCGFPRGFTCEHGCLWVVSGGCGIAKGDVDEEVGDVHESNGTHVEKGRLSVGLVVVVCLAVARVAELGDKNFAA